MTKYFIAKAVKGQEYFFQTSSMIAVPNVSAHKICDVLNKMNYDLKEDQVWHMYENDPWYDNNIVKEIKKYGRVMKVRSRV